MTGEKDKKHIIEFAALKAAAGRKAAAWSEVNSIRTEIDRRRSELQLLKQDMENLKREAGSRVLQLRQAGELRTEELDEILEKAEQIEAERVSLEKAITELEARVEAVKNRPKSNTEGTDPAPEEAETEAEYPIQCPACGARYRKAANFCRKCGALMNAEEITSENAVLETSRLILRKLKQEDYDGLCKILKDPETMYAYEHGFSDEEVREWLRRQQERYQQDSFGLWAVILKETGELIGQCGITIQEAEGKPVMEVGYLFNRSFWHRGYASEAATACRDYAFQALHAEEVYSIIRDSNASSIRVAEKNKMKRCGEIIKHYYDMDMPHYLYKITREEWGKGEI